MMLEPIRIWAEYWFDNVAKAMQPTSQIPQADNRLTQLVAQMDECLKQWDEENTIDRQKICKLEYLCMNATRGLK